MATHIINFTVQGTNPALEEQERDGKLRIYNTEMGHTVIPHDGGFGDPDEVRDEYATYRKIEGELAVDADGVDLGELETLADSLVISFVTGGESPSPAVQIEEGNGSYAGWFGADGDVEDVNATVVELGAEDAA
jgi:hypothetical protein